MPIPREVTVVLDAPRGMLPPFTIPSPYWQEAEPVVSAVREQFDLEIVILRVVEGETPFESPVTYLAELARGDATPWLRPWDGTVHDDPLRLPYARPGGPAADLAWAAQHVTITDEPEQRRTWNLSSIWKIPTDDGFVWLKHVPPFFAHESAMLLALRDQAPVPRIIAGEPGRMLLADVPGEDCYDADLSRLEAMLDALVALQIAWIDRVDEVLALGAPDWRRGCFVDLAADVVARKARRPSFVPCSTASLHACRRCSTSSRPAASRTRSCTVTSIRATCAGPEAAPSSSIGAMSVSDIRSSTFPRSWSERVSTSPRSTIAGCNCGRRRSQEATRAEQRA